MDAITLVFTGDLVLDEPDPDYWLSGIAPMVRDASLAIGHLEVPHTRRGHEQSGDVPAPGADPAYLAALSRAGFAAVTLAGNHIADCGAEGIADTVAELQRLDIASCGAGADLSAARAPAWLHAGTFSVALLSYNCVGPENGWASDTRAGCAYIRIRTADGSAVTPNAPLLAPDPQSLALMATDIDLVRREADLVIVALHKGIVHTPAMLAPYERPLAQAVVDAGADIVVSHHAHLLRGIEFHHGKPIYHGLGNGCVVTRALSMAQDHPARAAWARRRRELFGFEPDPAYALAPFHPEAVNAMLAHVSYRPGELRAGFVPIYVEPPGRPVLADARQALDITRYLERITALSGLPPWQAAAQGGVVHVQ